jgi:hypothetical protein
MPPRLKYEGAFEGIRQPPPSFVPSQDFNSEFVPREIAGTGRSAYAISTSRFQDKPELEGSERALPAREAILLTRVSSHNTGTSPTPRPLRPSVLVDHRAFPFSQGVPGIFRTRISRPPAVSAE